MPLVSISTSSFQEGPRGPRPENRAAVQSDVSACLLASSRKRTDPACHVPDTCPRHVTQTRVPDTWTQTRHPDTWTQTCHPDICPRHVTQTRVPDMSPRYVSQTHGPRHVSQIRGPRHVTQIRIPDTWTQTRVPDTCPRLSCYGTLPLEPPLDFLQNQWSGRRCPRAGFKPCLLLEGSILSVDPQESGWERPWEEAEGGPWYLSSCLGRPRPSSSAPHSSRHTPWPCGP